MGEVNYNYYKTKKYRCLVEYDTFRYRFSPENLYFTMCGVERCTPDKGFGPRARDGYHLHAVLSGKGVLKVNDKIHKLHAGQLFMQKPGEVTYYHPDRNDPWVYCWITFDGADARKYSEAIGFTEGCNCLTSYTDVNEYYRLVDQMLSKPELTDSSQLQRYGLMMQFLGLMLESGKKAYGTSSDYAVNQSNYIEYAKDYIKYNYSEIKVADISDYLGIDRSYLASLFRQQVGVSPQKYLLMVRLKKSMGLLLHTQLTVNEIASYVGYSSAMNFAKAFKKTLGVSPSQYRELSDEHRPVLNHLIIEEELG